MTYKAMLQTERAKLTSKTVLREELAVERVPEPMDDVQHAASRDLVIASLNRHWKTVREINAALLRLRDGSFGECTECAEAISERRLRALPWAPLCLCCQEAADALTAHELFVTRAA